MPFVFFLEAAGLTITVNAISNQLTDCIVQDYDGAKSPFVYLLNTLFRRTFRKKLSSLREKKRLLQSPKKK
ncbi:uncharacterized protein EV154DRAFT_516873 [Mucor mucedo]|uniref:uncharacterized protein n=1 Tax=Mucor mucedo TaxID=29922 RepID=UPI00221F19A6|nr:uncharacterized protein EV154DRAFT_516873 [Mucor mucedo]KAI7888648.1 hypothetical protein EV154DRAFT_516873 [Mucor mucedo]